MIYTLLEEQILILMVIQEMIRMLRSGIKIDIWLAAGVACLENAALFVEAMHRNVQ